MANRIWEGRCEDCYGKKTLMVCSDPRIVPIGMSAELCDECISRRKCLCNYGADIEIGLNLTGTWEDVEPLRVRATGQTVAVSVKHMSTGENAGIVRLRFDGQKKWMAAGAFGTSPIRALSEAKHFIRTHYFPHCPVEFL